MENYIAIGDIHGRFDLLSNLLDKIGPMPMHKYVFLGDMVDRGPESFEVVNRIKAMCEAGSAIALLGNHEDMMLDYHAKKYPDHYDVWMMNGASKTVTSYLGAATLYGAGRFFQAFERSGHAAWLKSLPYFYETDKVFFSHAPVPKEKWRWRDVLKREDFRTDKNVLTWSCHGNVGAREDEFAHDHGKIAVCGHVHALQEGILAPRVYPHIIYADTGSGCAPHGPLTGIIITDGKFDGYIQAIPKELK